MPSDAESLKLLYVIVKQLDTKPINWAHVAEETGIPNGNAASTRYYRLKKQMDGGETTPKGDKTTTSRKRKKDLEEAEKGNKKSKHAAKDLDRRVLTEAFEPASEEDSAETKFKTKSSGKIEASSFPIQVFVQAKAEND
ncbi:MAG: hypothetical protein Q9222_002228 [Ikaeria aurantiellina]